MAIFFADGFVRMKPGDLRVHLEEFEALTRPQPFGWRVRCLECQTIIAEGPGVPKVLETSTVALVGWRSTRPAVTVDMLHHATHRHTIEWLNALGELMED